MGFGDVSTKKPTGGFGATSKKTTTKKAAPLTTIYDLEEQALTAGLGKQAARIVAPPKLSVLQRISKGLGAFNPAEAILTTKERGLGAGIGRYTSGIAQDVSSAVTGKDNGQSRRTFSAVAEELGVENKIAKAGIGFLGDVFLDPSTYFGGALAKGILGTVKFGTKAVAKGVVLKGIGKVSPKAEVNIIQSAEGLQDAFGKAFQFGYKATPGAREDVLTFLSKKQKAQFDVAVSNLERLGTGTLNKSQREELVMRLIAGKRAEFGAREAGQSLEEAGALATKTTFKGATGKVAETLKEQVARSKEFATQAGFENPYETYFPFIKKEKLSKFLNETSGIKVGSEGYRKQFKNLLTNENLELDPAKAFFSSESQIVSDKMSREFLSDFVAQHGKQLTDFADDGQALKAGFKLIKEKGNFGKNLGYVSTHDADLIRNGLTPEFQTIDMFARATGYDAVTSLFKRAVTGLFVPFHVRNYASGLMQNYEVVGAKALDPRIIASAQKLAYIAGKGDEIPEHMKSVVQPFIDRFSGDTFYNNDFLQALDSGGTLKQAENVFSKSSFKEAVRTGGLGQNSVHFKAARAVGQYIEHQQKAGAYLASLAQGKSTQEALNLAEKAGFDYRALTRFESQILRRIIPFYSFTRKNIELQLKTLGENPQRINNIINLLENAQGDLTEKEREQLPDYAKEQFVVKTGETKPGIPEVAVGFGTPVEAFATLFGVSDMDKSALSDSIRKTGAMLNPVIKVPLERAFNKDFFRDRPLNEVIEATEYQKAPKWVKDFLEVKEVTTKDKYGKPKTKYNANPLRLQLLRNLPSARGATYLNAIFSDSSDTSKILSATTGIKPRPIDLETVQYFRERDQQRALEDLLIQAGVLKRFENTYVPANTPTP